MVVSVESDGVFTNISDCLLLHPPSGPSKHLSAQRARTEDESDRSAAGGGHFVHAAQHLHHHVRTSETLLVCLQLLPYQVQEDLWSDWVQVYEDLWSDWVQVFKDILSLFVTSGSGSQCCCSCSGL